MSQSYVMPAAKFEAMEKVRNLIHKQLIGDSVHATEVFTGTHKRAIKEAMETRQREIEAQGGRTVHRTSIGRNAPCPCGSGLKFKKCCIDKAALVG